jgi:hypothetical protein
MLASLREHRDAEDVVVHNRKLAWSIKGKPTWSPKSYTCIVSWNNLATRRSLPTKRLLNITSLHSMAQSTSVLSPQASFALLQPKFLRSTRAVPEMENAIAR